MKAALFAFVLGASTIATAAPAQAPSGIHLSSLTASKTSYVFETKGRTGSKRVGGKGRSGKGGHYVGGNK
jgi:hypothetical protein